MTASPMMICSSVRRWLQSATASESVRSVVLNRGERSESAGPRGADGTVAAHVTPRPLPFRRRYPIRASRAVRLSTPGTWLRRVADRARPRSPCSSSSSGHLPRCSSTGPASRDRRARASTHRSWLVGLAQTGAPDRWATSSCSLVFAVVGLAIWRSRPSATAPSASIIASGLGLVFVSIAFVVTGRQLPWSWLVFVASGLATSFRRDHRLPREVREVTRREHRHAARLATRPSAWIHIAGLDGVRGVRRVVHDRRDPGQPVVEAAIPTQAPPTRAIPTSCRGRRAGPPRERRRAVLRHRRSRHRPPPGRHVPAAPPRHRRSATIEFTKVGDRHRARCAHVDGRALVVQIHPPRHQHAVSGARSRTSRSTSRCRVTPRRSPLLDAAAVRRRGRDGRGRARPSRRRPNPRSGCIRHALAEGLAAFVRFAAPLASRTEFAGPRTAAPGGTGVRVSPPFSSSTTDPDHRSTSPPPPRAPSGSRRSAPEPARCSTPRPAAAPVVGHFDWRSENVPVSRRSHRRGVRLGQHRDRHRGRWSWARPRTTSPSTGGRESARARRSTEVQELRRRLRGRAGRARSPTPSASRPGPRTCSAPPTAPGASTCWRRAGQPAPTGFRDRLASAGAALARLTSSAPAGYVDRSEERRTPWHLTSSRARTSARRRCAIERGPVRVFAERADGRRPRVPRGDGAPVPPDVPVRDVVLGLTRPRRRGRPPDREAPRPGAGDPPR